MPFAERVNFGMEEGRLTNTLGGSFTILPEICLSSEKLQGLYVFHRSSYHTF